MKKIKLFDKIRRSPIDYFSDLFIVAMVLLWIADNVYQAIIASAVTITSIILSNQTGMNCYDTTMWSSIGSNVAIPLSCGGAVWMIKNSIQHAISNYKGKEAHKDFPAIYADGESEEIELEQPMVSSNPSEEEPSFEPVDDIEEEPVVEEEPIRITTKTASKWRTKVNDYFGNLLTRLVDRFDPDQFDD